MQQQAALDALINSMPSEIRNAAKETYGVARSQLGQSHEEALRRVNGLPGYLGWEHIEGSGWIKKFQAARTRSVVGVEIFAAGTWTDSGGDTRTWTEDDIQHLAEAAKAGMPGRIPLKAGHTSPAFNQKLAEALGVPQELVAGEAGQGQIALGQVTNLRVQGQKLLADFTDVPEPVADLIDMQGSAGFTSVSVEVRPEAERDGQQFGPIITAVALLGAEEPAVESLRGLEAATVMQGRQAVTLSFGRQKVTGQSEDYLKAVKKANNAETTPAPIKDFFGKVADLARSMFGQSDAPEPKEASKVTTETRNFHMPGGIASALGLGEDATEEQAVAAINRMKGGNGDAEESRKHSKPDEDLVKRVETLETENAALRHQERVRTYAARAVNWGHLQKKPNEVAEELARIEEKAGKEVAETIATQHDEAAKAFRQSAVFQRYGNPADGVRGDSDFEAEVQKCQKEHPDKSQAEAYKHVMTQRPELYRAYSDSRKIRANGSQA